MSSSYTHILGVDPGTTTGLALIRVYPDTSTWSMVHRTQEAGVDGGAGLWRLYSALNAELALTFGFIKAVAMEELMAFTTTAQEKAEAQAVVRMLTFGIDVPLHTYAPTTVRALVVGHGRAKEADVRKVTRGLIGAPARPKKGEGFPNHQQDALAAALCCALSLDLLRVVQPAVPLVVNQKTPVRR